MTQIIISAVADGQIGTGHLRRMMTLALELAGRPDCTVAFQTSALGAAILGHGTPRLTLLPPLTTTAPDAVRDSLEATLHAYPADVLVLDNYFWTADAERSLHAHCRVLCIVDDLADRPHEADLLLDQNANRDPQDYRTLVSPSCALAVGRDYCLIARPFRLLRAAGLPSSEERASLDAVFLSFGGGDPHRDLLRTVRVLLEGTQDFIRIATGSHIADAAALAALAAARPERIELALDSDRVAAQMNACGYAVSAGGTMTWERAVLGLPSLSVTIADNQAEASEWLAEQGLHDVFDMRGEWTEMDLLAAVHRLRANRARRVRQSSLIRALIDGQGVARVADRLLALARRAG